MAIKILLVISIIILLFVSLLFFSVNRPTNNYYHNYEQAVTGIAEKDFWMPGFIDQSATDIYVEYGVDPSFLRLQYSYKPQKIKLITQNFEELKIITEKRRVLRKLNASRWNNKITNNSLLFVPKNQLRNHFESKVYLFIDQTQNIVWYSID